MNRALVFFLFIILCKNLPAQLILNSFSGSVSSGEEKAKKTLSENEIVYTPFGPAKKSDVHYVGKNHHLEIKNSTIELVNSITGKTERIYSLKSGESGTKYFSQPESLDILSGFNDEQGWITYATCQIYVNKPEPTFLSTDWIVPNHPTNKSSQGIVIFNGLVGYGLLNGRNMAYILQPCLQWTNPAGSNGKWTIFNTLVTSDFQCFYDTLITVNPGDTLQGVVRLISDSDTSLIYNSSFTGYPSGLTVKNVPILNNPYFALEVYGAKDCSHYPADEKIRMFNIQLMIDSVYPPLIWHTYTLVGSCGQFTNVINESSKNGEVNIHFRKPYSHDGFDKIFVYPSPVTDLVHFSITDPVIYCTIEVYNSFGILLHTEKHESLEWGYDLNFSHYKPGIYFIKFYFQKNTVTRQESHVFKIIKI